MSVYILLTAVFILFFLINTARCTVYRRHTNCRNTKLCVHGHAVNWYYHQGDSRLLLFLLCLHFQRTCTCTYKVLENCGSLTSCNFFSESQLRNLRECVLPYSHKICMYSCSFAAWLLYAVSAIQLILK